MDDGHAISTLSVILSQFCSGFIQSLTHIPINLSAKFWSPMFANAVANVSQVAPSSPSLSIHFTKRAMQHSLLETLSLSILVMNVSLNFSSRAKSFHLVPISSGRWCLWMSDSVSPCTKLGYPAKKTNKHHRCKEIIFLRNFSESESSRFH